MSEINSNGEQKPPEPSAGSFIVERRTFLKGALVLGAAAGTTVGRSAGASSGMGRKRSTVPRRGARSNSELRGRCRNAHGLRESVSTPNRLCELARSCRC